MSAFESGGKDRSRKASQLSAAKEVSSNNVTPTELIIVYIPINTIYSILLALKEEVS